MGKPLREESASRLANALCTGAGELVERLGIVLQKTHGFKPTNLVAPEEKHGWHRWIPEGME